MPSTLTLDVRIPADVRKRVSAEGSAIWYRAVPGGRMVLSTRRVGTRLTTEITGVEPGEARVAHLDLCPGGDL